MCYENLQLVVVSFAFSVALGQTALATARRGESLPLVVALVVFRTGTGQTGLATASCVLGACGWWWPSSLRHRPWPDRFGYSVMCSESLQLGGGHLRIKYRPWPDRIGYSEGWPESLRRRSSLRSAVHCLLAGWVPLGGLSSLGTQGKCCPNSWQLEGYLWVDSQRGSVPPWGLSSVGELMDKALSESVADKSLDDD